MESFEQLVEQYEPMIHKIFNSLHLYKNKDEFYQQALIALWEASRRYNPEKGTFTNYAYSYIRGHLLMELKKIHRHSERNLYPKEEFWTAVEDQNPVCPLELETLFTYCSTLTPNQRKWVLYSVLYGFSTKEIAEMEKVSVSAIKLWRAGAKEKIKDLVLS
ncbi:sigma-70 family RNA polymerase sigma factor [Neobacillus pocheonensis]|uniref:sigma-70 family RNA polymerase sigma factor n=1 Tax=Neobacillus pocheonensis TaxID=363869 RepID=UPI003D294FD2